VIAAFVLVGDPPQPRAHEEVHRCSAIFAFAADQIDRGASFPFGEEMTPSAQGTFAARLLRAAAGHPHLTAGLLAIAIFAAALVGGVVCARHLESRYVRSLAELRLRKGERSAALSIAALNHPDLLLFYGSSELEAPNPLRAADLFRTYPTGFQVFPVGRGGTTPLIMLQDLAAVGSTIRGKRVAVSLSPTWFYGISMIQLDRIYAGNFSPLEAYALAFSTDFSRGLRRNAARSMLRYRRTLRDPLLRLSLQALASRRPSSRTLYAVVWPLGKLEELVLRLQEHWKMVKLVQGYPDLPRRILHEPLKLDWPDILSEAEEANAVQRPIYDRPYGKEMESNLRQSAQWTDLELLLEGLKQLGARPLVLSMPIAGSFYDGQGISREARHELYYERLRQLAERHGVRLIDFENEDEDADFLSGVGSHLSSKGWVYYDQTLDRFYHGALD
jgi:D-alanine transfer protein